MKRDKKGCVYKKDILEAIKGSEMGEKGAKTQLLRVNLDSSQKRRLKIVKFANMQDGNFFA